MVRKIIVFAMLVATVFSFSSCGRNSEQEITTTEQMQTTAAMPDYENTTAYQESTAAAQETTAAVTTAQEETQAASVTTAASTVPTTQSLSSRDAQWVVSFYKEAAAATGNSVRSEQVIALEDISVNNGQLGGVFNFVTPILSSFLSSSSTVTDGITGNFSLLTSDDVSSARAYEASQGTAVEITLKEQSVNAAENSDVGVSHGISVVADLPSIMAQLREKGLPIEISLENTVMTYKNPVIRAVVDESGKIVNGTWSCTVEISLSDYKFAGSAVESTRVVLDNKITVGSGFNP